MKFLCALGVLAVHFSVLRADVVVEYAVEDGKGETEKSIVMIKGDMGYTRVGEIGMIIDLKSGAQTVVDHHKKQFVKLPKGYGRDMVEMAEKIKKDAPKPVKTGRTEKVGDYACEEWVVKVAPGIKMVILATKDHPDYEVIKAALDKLIKVVAPTTDFTAGVDGLMMRTLADIGGERTGSTLISAKVTVLDDAEFKVPAGYAERVAP